MNIKLLSVVLFTTNIALAETGYCLPPVRYVTLEEMHEQFLNDGKELMDIKGIPDASASLVCANWTCPTSIVVNAVRYSLVTDEWKGVISADIMTTNFPLAKKGSVRIYWKPNAKEARRTVFAAYNQSSSLTAADIAPFITAHNLDPSTNMMYIAKQRDGGTNRQFVVYRNLSVCADAPTNAVDFAAAIINEGLPENERITLPPAP